MKKLSIEEKAKAYDSIIEKANKMHCENCEACQMCIEELIPELAESEEERIRKYLKHIIGEWSYDDLFAKGFRKEDIIAWLEKQAQKPTDKVEPKFHEGDIIIHKELGGDYIHNPHKIIQVDILDKKYRLEGGLVAHFGEQEDYELVEQKPAWSEEDEGYFNSIAHVLSVLLVDPSFDEINLEHTVWFQSLKDRVLPQPKQEWSEEDERMLQNILECLKNGWRKLPTGILKYESWLKSLKPQNRWKPSDEQMHYLSWIANVKLGDSVVEQEVSKHLNELLEDLKKLKDE